MATKFSAKIITKALTAKCWIRRIDANHFRVTPRTLQDTKDRDHGIYIVAYTLDKDGLPTIESCRDARTRSQCDGFKFNDGSCYHGASVAIHVVKPMLRQSEKRVA